MGQRAARRAGVVTMVKAITFLAGLLLGLLLALGLATIAEDRLSVVERDYRAGTLFADSPAYASALSRSISLQLIRGTPARDLCTYQAHVDDVQQRGVLSIEYGPDGRVAGMTSWPVRTARSTDPADLMLLANAADMASTAAALTTGFAEANPLGVGGVIASKVAMHLYADVADYANCVNVRAGVAPTMAGVAVWNLSLLATPVWPLALVAGIVVAKASESAAYTDAVYHCLLP